MKKSGEKISFYIDHAISAKFWVVMHGKDVESVHFSRESAEKTCNKLTELSCEDYRLKNPQLRYKGGNAWWRRLFASAKGSSNISPSPETMIVAIDQTGTVVLVNGEVCEALGYEENELVGKNWFEAVVPEERREEVTAVFRKVIAGEAAPVEHYESEVVTKLGDRRLISWHSTSVRDGDGVIIGSLNSGEDITEPKRLEMVALKKEAPLAEARRTSPLGTWELDIVNNELRWSDEVYRIFGVKPQTFDATYEAFLDFVHPRDQGFVENTVSRAFSERQPYGIDHRIVLPDGTERTVHQQVVVHFDDAGRPLHMSGTVHDITEHMRAEENLRKLSQAVEQSPTSVIIADTEGNIEYVNRRFVEVTGYAPEEVIGENMRTLESGGDSSEVYKNLCDTITFGSEWRGTLRDKKKNGELIWEYVSISPIKALDGTITNFLSVKERITPLTVRSENAERLPYQVKFDKITGLPNGILAMDRLSQELARANRGNQPVGVIVVDLDNFKKVNDSVGRAEGDRLLAEAAARLGSHLRGSDTLARVGGDEFLIIVSDLDSAVGTEIVARKIRDAFTKPFALGEHEFFVTASIGIAVYPGDGDTPRLLIQNAETAMYQAKKIGHGVYRFFMPTMNEVAIEHMKMESHLFRALEREELFLHYQPLVDTRSGMAVGAEALLRWRNPELGLVPPDRFISLAEDTGLIVPIGEWVLRTACRDAKTWQAGAGLPLRVMVNISGRQFKAGNLVETVSRALEENEFSPEFLTLEITERSLVVDAPETTHILSELSKMGIRLAIDDFGTGFSSLSYLNRFPFDILKIDRAFLQNVTSDPEGASLTVAIIAMARSLGLEVIGEGAETEEQLQFLNSHGCVLVQGYLFSEPLAPEDFANLLQGWKRRSRAVITAKTERGKARSDIRKQESGARGKRLTASWSTEVPVESLANGMARAVADGLGYAVQGGRFAAENVVTGVARAVASGLGYAVQGGRFAADNVIAGVAAGAKFAGGFFTAVMRV